MSAPRVSAVVPAAGLSRRFAGNERKQFAALRGEPVFARCLRTFESSGLIEEVVVVVSPGEIPRVRETLRNLGFEKVISVIGGGEKRSLSVRNGFLAVPPQSDMVLIHDAARPFVDCAMIRRAVERCSDTGASVCAVPVTDTLKRAEEPGPFISETVAREKLWRAQTPQVFRREILERIYRSQGSRNLGATDEAALAEAMGISVSIAPGSELNIKITTAADLETAELIAYAMENAQCTE